MVEITFLVGLGHRFEVTKSQVNARRSFFFTKEFSMGERRKRKSLWDQEKDTKQSVGESEHNSLAGKEHDSCHDIGRNIGFSASVSYAASTDHPGQPTLTSITKTPVAPMHDSFLKTIQDAPEGKEVGGGNRDYQNMSPGSDGTGQDKHKQNLGNGRERSDRYMRRGRSRSRSRSRTRGRSRSRSLSRGRGRGRGRGRSRSDSSRSDGTSARGRVRSRSPRGDYKRQSFGWSDKRSAPDRSSRICRDFSAGNCRRGGQCRFFHPKSVSHGESEALGDNTGESRRDTADNVQISKSSFNKCPQSDLQGDVSDPYHRQDDQFRNKSKNAVPCKDFIKGRCRWGDSCRFAHHLDNDATCEKNSRNKSFSKDIEQQPDKNGKVICKYFAAGNCDRGNCRFSHENPKLRNLDGRQDEVAKDTKSHDMNSWRNPTSNDTSRISDNVKAGGWSETIGTVTNSIGEPTEAKNDNRWGHMNKGLPDNSVNLDKQLFVPGTIGGYGGGMETVESIGKEEMTDKPELLNLHGSHLHNLEGNAKVQGQNTVHQDPKYFMELRQQHVPPILHVQQQHHGVVESNLGTSLMSGVLDEVEKSGNAAQSNLFSRQNLNQNGENVLTGLSSILDGTGSGQNMLSHVPTVESSDIVSMPYMHKAAPLNLESQMQNHLKVVQATRILETKLPHLFPSLLTSQHPSQLADTTVAITDQHVAPAAIPSNFPNQGFVNEQPQKNTDLDTSNPEGMAPFFDISGNVPLVNSANVQFNQVRVSHDSKESGRCINEHVNDAEQGSGMKMGQSYPFPAQEPDDLKRVGSGTQKLNQETLHTDPEVDKNKGDDGNKNKGEQNNKHSVPPDSHGKVEEKSVSKDDKAMRTFKNSLIEFVKDILKPTWKEGQMSRDIHKTIVKKVVEKVTSTIQVDHIPKTQDKVEQYLSYSKPKIAKLVQAYVARCLKTDSGGDT